MEKLTLFEMSEIAGGVSRKQYCDTLDMILSNCDPEGTDLIINIASAQI